MDIMESRNKRISKALLSLETKLPEMNAIKLEARIRVLENSFYQEYKLHHKSEFLKRLDEHTSFLYQGECDLQPFILDSLWEWKDGSYWITYDYFTAVLLETAYQYGLSSIDLFHEDYMKRGGYCVSFHKWIQANITKKFNREIRRRDKNEIRINESEAFWEANVYKDVWVPIVTNLNIDKFFISNQEFSFTTEIDGEPHLMFLNFPFFREKDSNSGETFPIRRREKDSFKDTGIIPFELYLNENAFRTQETLSSQLVELNSKEFEQIMMKLKRCRLDPSFEIIGIYRIYNKDLLELYNSHKKFMQRQSSVQPLELQLFHGTKVCNVSSIISNGFDWRYNKRHVYGRGNYFALNFDLAHTYTSQDETQTFRQIFLANVLVGEYSTSNGQDGEVPAKSTGLLYDTLVDRTLSPTIFITFERGQSYPSYVISYISHK